MVQRAVVKQRCGVCIYSCSSKAEMDEHVEMAHGTNWQPAELRRSEDQKEFRGPSPYTPWGKELR